MMAAVQPFLSGAISKCLVGSTLVPTSTGIRRLETLSENRDPDTFESLPTMRVSGETGETPATAFYYNGAQPTWKMVLSDGRALQGTGRHRVRVVRGDDIDWVRLDEVQVGDWVPVQLGANLWAGDDVMLRLPPLVVHGSQKTVTRPRRMTPELARLLGMITADGHITRSTWSVGFTKNSDEARDEFTALVRDLFGLVVVPTTDSRNGCRGARVHSKTLVEFLDTIGFSKEQIPDLVLQSSRDSVVAYLNGIYLDGHVSQSISLCQRRALLEDVQAVWTNLGVATYWNDKVVNDKNYPVLHVSAPYRELAAGILTFIEPHKTKRAAALRDGDTEPFPFPAWREKLCEAARDQHKTQDFRTVLDSRTKTLRRSTALDAAAALGVEIPDRLTALAYREVVSVEPAGVEDVFDISVPDGNAYVANGMISHNTVNLPTDCTVEDIENAYMQAWKLGLKAIAVYRDGCKRTQPLSTSRDQATSNGRILADVLDMLDDEERRLVEGLRTRRDGPSGPPAAVRYKLPTERPSFTHKFSVGGHEGYITVGLYEDGKPGEIFVRMAKEGSVIAGLMDSFALAISLALQHGVPLKVLCDKFRSTRFEPSGFTGNQDIPIATSIMDYIFRWLSLRFLDGERHPAAQGSGKGQLDLPSVALTPAQEAQVRKGASIVVEHSNQIASQQATWVRESDAPPCHECGTLMVRNGACHKCPNCGSTSGCS
jgi:hypothetical protein